MIILVRHGEATHHTLHLTGGWTDSALTEKGKSQIEAVAAALAADYAARSPALRILSSDLQRAASSAAIIAAALGRAAQVELSPFLREKNNGLAAGMTEEAAKKIYMPPAMPQELHHRNYPGGETRAEFYDRTIKGLLGCADPEQENLLLVAHKGTLQNIIFYWLGMDVAQAARLRFSVDIRPGSVTVLGINKWHEHAIFLLNALPPQAQQRGMGIFTFKYGKIEPRQPEKY